MKKTWHAPTISKLINTQTEGLGKQRAAAPSIENNVGSHWVAVSSILHWNGWTNRGSDVIHWQPMQNSGIGPLEQFGPS